MFGIDAAPLSFPVRLAAPPVCPKAGAANTASSAAIARADRILISVLPPLQKISRGQIYNCFGLVNRSRLRHPPHRPTVACQWNGTTDARPPDRRPPMRNPDRLAAPTVRRP